MARTAQTKTAKPRSVPTESARKAEPARKEKDEDAGALFIPAGVLTGMGFGFLFGNIPAGLFIGLGLGFLAFAITTLVLYSKRKRS
jgi:hypothetical protein